MVSAVDCHGSCVAGARVMMDVDVDVNVNVDRLSSGLWLDELEIQSRQGLRVQAVARDKV